MARVKLHWAFTKNGTFQCHINFQNLKIITCNKENKGASLVQIQNSKNSGKTFCVLDTETLELSTHDFSQNT